MGTTPAASGSARRAGVAGCGAADSSTSLEPRAGARAAGIPLRICGRPGSSASRTASAGRSSVAGRLVSGIFSGITSAAWDSGSGVFRRKVGRPSGSSLAEFLAAGVFAADARAGRSQMRAACSLSASLPALLKVTPVAVKKPISSAKASTLRWSAIAKAVSAAGLASLRISAFGPRLYVMMR